MRVTNIKREYKTTGLVESESNPGSFYKVVFEGGKMVCSCPHHMKAGAQCKHIEAFKAELDYLRDQQQGEQK